MQTYSLDRLNSHLLDPEVPPNESTPCLHASPWPGRAAWHCRASSLRIQQRSWRCGVDICNDCTTLQRTRCPGFAASTGNMHTAVRMHERTTVRGICFIRYVCSAVCWAAMGTVRGRPNRQVSSSATSAASAGWRWRSPPRRHRPPRPAEAPGCARCAGPRALHRAAPARHRTTTPQPERPAAGGRPSSPVNSPVWRTMLRDAARGQRHVRCAVVVTCT